MSTAEKIRELKQLIKAYESEISMHKLYLVNEHRWQTELRNEEERLRIQQQRVDRLKAYRETGEDGINRWYDRINEIKAQLALLENEDAVARYLKLLGQHMTLTTEEQRRLAVEAASAPTPA